MGTAWQAPPGARPNRDGRGSPRILSPDRRPGWSPEAARERRPRGMAATFRGKPRGHTEPGLQADWIFVLPQAPARASARLARFAIRLPPAATGPLRAGPVGPGSACGASSVGPQALARASARLARFAEALLRRSRKSARSAPARSGREPLRGFLFWAQAPAWPGRLGFPRFRLSPLFAGGSGARRQSLKPSLILRKANRDRTSRVPF
jgi:hypothetical protein